MKKYIFILIGFLAMVAATQESFSYWHGYRNGWGRGGYFVGRPGLGGGFGRCGRWGCGGGGWAPRIVL
ncbi:MAG: hypothetical protein WCG05_01760 [Alphaproteobacteria bacterium]